MSENTNRKAVLENLKQAKEKMEAEMITLKIKYEKMEELAKKQMPESEEEALRANSAVNENQKIKAKLTLALSMVEYKGEKISELQNMLTKSCGQLADEQAANGKMNVRLLEYKRSYEIKKKEANELKLRETRLEKRISDYRQKIKAKENEVMELQIQREKEIIKLEEVENELRQSNSKTEILEKQKIHAEKFQKDKIADLEKQLNDITKTCGNQPIKIEKESLEISVKNVSLKNEIIECQNLINSKDQQIVTLFKELNSQGEFFAEKIVELHKDATKAKTFEVQIAQLNAEIIKLENKCDFLRKKIDNENATFVIEKSILLEKNKLQNAES
uniref:Uncharacterized protein n=1 Tax=Panagrolaimus sp. ES5 TaxID=591445 RepID=A0AC34FT69_9BILA